MTVAPGPTPPASSAKSPVGDVIRRGFENTIANWQLIVIRIAEAMLFGIVAIGAVFAIVVPLLVSAGVWGMQLTDARNAADAVTNFLMFHWMIVVWILVIATVLLCVFALVHSFVVAGAARVLLDGEAKGIAGVRTTYSAFTMDRWLAGGRAAWWTVFWIYNLAYGAAALVMLIPALALLIAVLLLGGSPAAIVAGCLGLVLTIFVGVISAFAAGLWCQKAIVLAVRRSMAAGDALHEAWDEARDDATRHFAVALIMFVLGIGGVGVIGTLSIMITLPGTTFPMVGILFLPIRLLVSVIQCAIGAAVGNWTIASFAALR